MIYGDYMITRSLERQRAVWKANPVRITAQLSVILRFKYRMKPHSDRSCAAVLVVLFGKMNQESVQAHNARRR